MTSKYCMPCMGQHEEFQTPISRNWAMPVFCPCPSAELHHVGAIRQFIRHPHLMPQDKDQGLAHAAVDALQQPRPIQCQSRLVCLRYQPAAQM